MLVYPKLGVLVRDPEKRDLIPAEGRTVRDDDPYWLRRLADEDVTTEPPATAAAPRVKTSAAATTDNTPGSTDA